MPAASPDPHHPLRPVVPLVRATWLALVMALAANAAPAMPHDRDPLDPLIGRMDRYFQQHEVDGVTMDSRYSVSPSEAIRQSVVCQVLGYAELYRARPTGRLRDEVRDHADYLIATFDAIRSHTPFDGMLGYSLLLAYDVTREQRFMDYGRTVIDELKAIPTGQCVLNGGLMVAMATAEYAALTGDPESAQKTRDILSLLPPYQHEDGSFPHWCYGSKDIHYTDWMAQELIVIDRTLHDDRIEPMLARMHAFIEARLDSNGVTHYEDPCPDQPGCVIPYYSRATGCDYDYDTRGWTVEPGYSSLLLDHFQSPTYFKVMGFLLSLENRGTFPDLWCCWPPPSDPEYPWTVADTSVANMSIMFWSFALIQSGREAAEAHAPRRDGIEPRVPDAGDVAPPPATVPPPPVTWRLALEPAVPNPARTSAAIRITLPRAGSAALIVLDAGGRRRRTLVSGTLDAGPHTVTWDLRDDAGRRCPPGAYFVRLRTADGVLTGRLLALR